MVRLRLLPIPIFTLVALAACTGGVITGYATDEDRGMAVAALEGAELDAELAASPIRQTPDPFVRVGILWDADAPDALELSFSADGATWTAWQSPVVHHIELEATGAFVGQLELPEDTAASFYRLRGAPGRRATYARVEFFTTSQSESVQDGDDGSGEPRTLIGMADVHPRAEWGARASKCTVALGTPYRMAIHHTETPTVDSVSPEARIRNIQSYHMDSNGWCDIGYHFLISRDGRIWEGVSRTKRGTHTGGANTGNFGISMLGSHGVTPINDAQLDAIAGLIRGLADAHGIAMDRAHIKGHREYKSTDCPGNALYAQLDTIIAAAKTYGGGGGGSQMPVGVVVRGTLYVGSDTSMRIAGATVRLGAASTTTDALGQWQFTDIAPGEFTVTAEAAGYQARSITRTTSGAENWASFGLSPVGATTGTAVLQGVIYHTSDSSKRLPGATVVLSTGQTITADANGYYKLTGLPAGNVTITASVSGYVTGSVTRTLFDGQSEWGSVRLEPGVSVPPPPPPGLPTLPGTVGAWSCPSGQLTGKTLNAANDYYTTSYGCWTDANGVTHGDAGDNCIPACMSSSPAGFNEVCAGLSGKKCEEKLNWFVADADRFGCWNRLKVTNPDTGKAVIVAVIDRGPSCSIERSVNYWVLDMSYPASNYLFGGPTSASEHANVRIEVVAANTPLGPI